jgi:hypothetical protein
MRPLLVIEAEKTVVKNKGLSDPATLPFEGVTGTLFCEINNLAIFNTYN